MKKFLIIALASSVLVASPSDARKPPQISGLELQQMQARDYDAPSSVSFPSVMTVLQDAGYRILSADKDTGLITGTASTKSGMGYSLFGGFNKSKKTPMVSAFIESRGVGSRVRLSFVMAKTKSSLYGMSSADEEPILDPVVYRDAFEKVDKEMFVRLALQAPKSTPSPLPPMPSSPINPAIAAPAAMVVPSLNK